MLPPSLFCPKESSESVFFFVTFSLWSSRACIKSSFLFSPRYLFGYSVSITWKLQFRADPRVLTWVQPPLLFLARWGAVRAFVIYHLAFRVPTRVIRIVSYFPCSTCFAPSLYYVDAFSRGFTRVNLGATTDFAFVLWMFLYYVIVFSSRSTRTYPFARPWFCVLFLIRKRLI